VTLVSREALDFSRELYEEAARDYRRRVKLSDDMLYRLCRQHPSHRDPAAVHAKLSLIGRSYMTRLETLLEGNDAQSGNLNRWSEFFLRNAPTIDSILAETEVIRGRLTPRALTDVARLHGRLVRLLKSRIMRNSTPHMREKTPTSFVSKYLHFHNPSVPIYDSWASAGARGHHLLRSALDTLGDAPRGVDTDYWRFLRMFWCVYQLAGAALGQTPSVRHLDRYLLAVRAQALA